MYQIIHYYDVDGGFGDAIQKETILGCVETEKEAIAYCEKYSRPQIYEKPYNELWHHVLGYKELAPIDIEDCPWDEDSDWDKIDNDWEGDKCYLDKNWLF